MHADRFLEISLDSLTFFSVFEAKTTQPVLQKQQFGCLTVLCSHEDSYVFRSQKNSSSRTRFTNIKNNNNKKLSKNF